MVIILMAIKLFFSFSAGTQGSIHISAKRKHSWSNNKCWGWST